MLLGEAPVVGGSLLGDRPGACADGASGPRAEDGDICYCAAVANQLVAPTRNISTTKLRGLTTHANVSKVWALAPRAPSLSLLLGGA